MPRRIEFLTPDRVVRHGDSVIHYSVEIDQQILDIMAKKASHGRGLKSRDGALLVRVLRLEKGGTNAS